VANKAQEFIAKAKYLRRLYQKLKKHKNKIACRKLKYLDKLIAIKGKKHNKHEKETRREPQLSVSLGGISAPADTSLYNPQVDLPIDSDSTEALAAFDPLNPY
jgi:hypothetical protein